MTLGLVVATLRAGREHLVRVPCPVTLGTHRDNRHDVFILWVTGCRFQQQTAFRVLNFGFATEVHVSVHCLASLSRQPNNATLSHVLAVGLVGCL